MSKVKKQKAQVHTIEVVISISILAFVILSIVYLPTKPEFSIANLKLRIFEALKSLDSADLLREAAINGNSDFIKTMLQNVTPGNINYDVAIFNKTTNITAIPSTQGETAIVSYFISGDVGIFAPREIRVYLWGFS
jgi:hypothetical protein